MEEKAVVAPPTNVTKEIAQLPITDSMPPGGLIKTTTNTLPLGVIKVEPIETAVVVAPSTTVTKEIAQVPTTDSMLLEGVIKTGTNPLPLAVIKVEPTDRASQVQQPITFSSCNETNDMNDGVDIVAQEQQTAMFSDGIDSEDEWVEWAEKNGY